MQGSETMTQASQAALDFLLTRRSRPAKTLTTPVPDRRALEPILHAALRAPDHGKLEPWRLVVLTRPALGRLATAVEVRGAELGFDEAGIAKARAQYADGHLAVAVIFSPVESAKIPEIEQILSAGAVCLQLLNAALASGWGANWLTGWPVHDRLFAETQLGLAPAEQVAGVIFIGTETTEPPERPRPDPAAKIDWREA